MRFLDTNVLVYALVQPKGKLSVREQEIIENAKNIMFRIEKGELVMCSVVHLSEFANIVQRRQGVSAVCDALQSLLGCENFRIVGVNASHYALALEISMHSGVGVNDCLAIVLMTEYKLYEIYSFDKDFDRLDVKRAVC